MQVKQNSLPSHSKVINASTTYRQLVTASVKKSDHCPYLGVTIDKHLGFQTQVTKVLKNGSR